MISCTRNIDREQTGRLIYARYFRACGECVVTFLSCSRVNYTLTLL